jgi:hypothetical protein
MTLLEFTEPQKLNQAIDQINCSWSTVKEGRVHSQIRALQLL